MSLHVRHAMVHAGEQLTAQLPHRRGAGLARLVAQARTAPVQEQDNVMCNVRNVIAVSRAG